MVDTKQFEEERELFCFYLRNSFLQPEWRTQVSDFTLHSLKQMSCNCLNFIIDLKHL